MERRSAELKFVELSPKAFEFAVDVRNAKLQIKNVTKERVAWRLRCDTPSSYIAYPNYGFLMEDEAVLISIELVEKNRFRREHSFLLQAMKAEHNDTNKRKVWLSDRAQQITNIQHVHIRSTYKDCYTLLVSSLSNLSLEKSRSDSDAICSNTPLSVFSSSETPSAGNVFSGRTTGVAVDQKALIDEISSNIQKAIADKAAFIAKNIQQINEIKMLEMELEKLQYSINDWQVASRKKSTEIEESKKKL